MREGPVVARWMALMTGPQRSNRLTAWRSLGGLSQERTAGMKVISMIRPDRMPMPVKMPKLRMVAMLKVVSEKKPITATRPAASITGATLLIDCSTASRLAASGARPRLMAWSNSS